MDAAAARSGLRDRRPSPQRVFLLLALVFGASFAIVTPPFDAPDERRHFGRAYRVSEGDLTVPGFSQGRAATLPMSLFRLHPAREGPRCHHEPAQLIEQLRHPQDLERRGGSNRLTTQFAPLAYLPQALAIAVGRVLGVSAAGLLYLGRFANLLVWVALVGWGIRVAPVRRWALVVLALTPMAVFLSGSITADSTMTALALVFFAVVLRAAVDRPESLTAGELWGIVGWAAAMGLAKPGYWGLAALVWLIPVGRFESPRQRRLVLAAVVAVVVFPTAIWVVLTQIAEPAALGPAADPVAQIRGMLSAPWSFAAIAGRTLMIQWFPWLAGFVGVLGEVDVPLPTILYALLPAVLVLLCTFDGQDPDFLVRKIRIAMVLLFLVCATTLLAMAYAGWNPVGYRYIADVHGRYFLPLAPVAMLAISSRRPLPRLGEWCVVVFCAGMLATSLWEVVGRYYLR